MSVGHYENFPVASALLPAPLREPVAVIYRFARCADDFADEGDDPPALRLEKLDAFRAELRNLAAPRSLLFDDVARIVREHALPVQLFHDLLDAFSQDLVKARYADFPELLDYCRRSANPIGRLLLHLFKRTSETDCRRSDAICSALQLVNFWQDVPIDYAKGRIYIPQDEMQRCGVSEQQIADGRSDGMWPALMEIQAIRSRVMLETGAPLGRELPGRIGLEIRATVQGGLRILEKLKRTGYDMFRHRPVLRWFDWPLLLARALGK